MTMTHHPTTITAAPGVPFIDVVREFDAPPAAVYRAHIDPDLFAKWTGPRDMRMDQVEIDARPGGRWKFEFRAGSQDAPMSFFGVFHALEPNALIIQTFEFSLAPTQAGISLTHFDDLGGRTRLRLHEVYPSVEARDGAVASGMAEGVREGYERLDEVLVA